MSDCSPFQEDAMETTHEDWKVNPLQSVSKKIWIGLVTTMTKHYVSKGVPLIRNSDIKDRKINTENLIHLDVDFANENKSRAVNEGDVVTVHTGDIGTSSVIGKDLNGAHGFATLNTTVNKNIVDNEYYCIFLNSDFFKRQANRVITGDGRSNLNLKDFIHLSICHPDSIPEQQKIASILTSVDTVIEKTEAQINKLKDLKKAMMQELLTKGIGHTEFKDSPVGRIPVSWEVKSLGDISIVKRGASPRPIKDPKWWGGNTGWVRISNVTKSGKFLNETTNYLSEAGVNQSVRMNIGDVIMSICATIGRPIIVNTDVCIHDGFVWFDKLSDEINKEYLYYLLSTKEEYLSQQRQTGTQGNLNTSIVSRLEIAIPPLQEQLRLLSIFNCLDSNVDEKQNKLSQTKSLKKALMQNLLTGKVRVNP